MPEEKIASSYARMHRTPEIVPDTPQLHRDNSQEYQYIVEVSHDLPAIRLRVFLFPNGDAMTEAEFMQ